MAEMVRFDGVSKSFTAGKQTVTAVDGIDLTIEQGEIFGIIGYSGAGKSTLVRLINGLERATAGTITVDGVDVTALSESGLRPIRTGIGMIFQQFNLFRSRTVAGNVAYPLKVAGWPKQRRTERVAELLEFVGLSGRAGAYPDQLSGGQKQRVGIARALATSPKLLLADESTSSLDPETTQEVLRLLQKINRELGVTVIVITHEMDVVRTIGDRVAVLDGGRIVEQGAVFEVFSNPKTETARRFVGTVVRDRPTSGELARLRTNHPGRLVTAQVQEGGGVGAILSDAAHLGVRFEIVYGGISALQDRSFGSLTLELTGSDAGIDELIARLREHTTVEEIEA